MGRLTGRDLIKLILESDLDQPILIQAGHNCFEAVKGAAYIPMIPTSENTFCEGNMGEELLVLCPFEIKKDAKTLALELLNARSEE